VAKIVLTIAAVVALGAGMAGVAFGDEPSTDPPQVLDETTTSSTTATTAPTTPTTVPADDPCVVDPTAEGCTPPDTATTTPDLGALDVGALATNSIQVTKNTPGSTYPGTFYFRAQKETCVFVIVCSWGSTIEQSITTSGGTGATTFNLPSNGKWRIQELTGSGSIITGAPPGWTYGSVSCSPTGSPEPNGRRFNLTNANPNASCTFTNTENTVTVSKTVSGAPDGSWSFPVRLFSLLAYDQTLNLTAAQPSQTFHTVPATLLGYTLTESTPEGWRLTDVSCSGGATVPWLDLLPLRQTGVAFGGLFGNPTRSCTFTNANNRVTVSKVVDPATYTGTFDIVLEKCDFNVFANCIGNWSAVDTAPVAGGSAVTFSTLEGTYFDRYYRVSEDVPDGWTSGIECTGGRQHSEDGGYAYFLFPLSPNVEAAIDCTVTNTAQPSSLTIAKSTDPAGGGPFDFTLGGPSIDPADDFSLSDGQTAPFSDLELGDYALSETSAPAGEDWVFATLTCEADPASPNDAPVTPVSNGNATWTIPLGPGQDVTCTADNRQASIGLVITPTPTSGVVGDTITFEYKVTNTGKVPLTNLTVVSDLFGPITLGATDLAPGDSTTGTFAHTAVAGDVPQITDTATATADIDTGAIVLSDVSSQALDPVSVTATSSATVVITEVGGETAIRGTSTGLPFTGGDPRPLLGAGLVLLAAGLALGIIGWRRRRSLLDA